MAGTATLSSTLLLQKSLPFPSQISKNLFDSFFIFNRGKVGVFPIVVCSAKRKLSFVDQILDYIEGGPKLRKWYGAPDLLPKDEPTIEDEDDYTEDEVRDAVLVADRDSEMSQMAILSLIVKRTCIKALVKDKRVALDAFGSYVEEGFISSVGSLQGVKHVILLSQGCAARGSISKEDAAFVCVQALDCVLKTGFIFKVANGEQKVSDWKEFLAGLMEKSY